MSDHVRGTVWLVGAGGMAVEYARVLADLGVTPIVIGRGHESASAFRQKTGLPVVGGGLQAFLRTGPEKPEAAIIAVNVVDLARTAASLLDYCRPRILLEKPGLATSQDLRLLQSCTGTDELFVAYNRRFFASTQAVRTMLAEDGGPVGCVFEFTEWSHRIATVVDRKHPAEMAHWLLANSSHVIDLAFHLAGEPRSLDAIVTGSLPWHPSGSAFCGSGLTDRGVTFSYHANWKAPGRWWVEAMSERRRFRMCPMESVQVQAKGELTWTDLELDDSADRRFKPGLRSMVADFLSLTPSPVLCRFDEQARALGVYQKIAGYTD